MKHHEALEALKNGDFQTAASLLEAAARENGYTSDLINHAYTLALHQGGDTARLADVSFQIGNALRESDPASAMDYFQRALVAGLDAKHTREIGEVFEGWAEPQRQRVVRGPVDRVAHVVGCLIPGQPLTRYIKSLVAGLRQHGVQSTIFTTESTASWFFNSAVVPQSETAGIDADIHVASLDGNFLERAEKIAEAIRASEIQAVFFHGSLTDQIMARVAAMRACPVQINVSHGSEMDADLFHGFIHPFENAMKRTRFTSHPAECIFPASDIESRLKMNPSVTRQSLGLESSGSVSATYGDLSEISSGGYGRVLSEILNRFPKHSHLFAGVGNVRGVRSVLHSEGVLPRVRFLGPVGDVAPLLPVIDVYLDSFPRSCPTSVIEAMGAGKPVVVLRSLLDPRNSSAAELVGARELIAPGEADYIQMVDKLLRDATHRQQQGEAMRVRFQAEFRPERQGKRYLKFLETVIGSGKE